MRQRSGYGNLKVLLAFAAVYIIWGTTYLAIKIGVRQLPPFVMASMRYLIAGVLLLGFCIIKRERLFSDNVVKQVLLGAFMLTLGQGVIFWAEQYMSSGLTAVFTATLSIWYILIDGRNRAMYFRSKLTLISIALGLIGIITLFSGQISLADGQSGTMRVVASAVVLCSCFCWAASSLYYKNHRGQSSLLVDVGWQLAGGTVACFVVSVVTGEWNHFTFSAVNTASWGAVFYLAIAGSIVAFSAALYLLTVRPPAVVGTYAYVNPIIAVLIGVAAGELVTVTQIAGIVIILVAAYLANRVKIGKTAEHAEPTAPKSV